MNLLKAAFTCVQKAKKFMSLTNKIHSSTYSVEKGLFERKALVTSRNAGFQKPGPCKVHCTFEIVTFQCVCVCVSALSASWGLSVESSSSLRFESSPAVDP